MTAAIFNKRTNEQTHGRTNGRSDEFWNVTRTVGQPHARKINWTDEQRGDRGIGGAHGRANGRASGRANERSDERVGGRSIILLDDSGTAPELSQNTRIG